MLHIKLQGMEHRAPCKYIFYPNTHTLNLCVGLKGKKILNIRNSYQIKGNIEANTLTLNTPLTSWSG